MWLKRSAEFVLQTRWHAIGFAVLFTLAPLLGWIGAVIVCVVTLRKGIVEGVIVMLASALLVNLILFILGYPLTVPLGLLTGFIGGAVLQRTHSWIILIEVMTLLGMAGVLIAHFVVPNLPQFWQQIMMSHFDQIKTATLVPLTVEQAQFITAVMSRIITGIIAALVVISSIANTVVARWVQSLFETDIKVREPLLNLRIDWALVLILAGVIASLFLHFIAALDLIPIISLPFILVGISLVHFFANKSRYAVVALVGFYVFLIVLAHYALGLLMVLALVDRIFDLRRYRNGSYSTRKNA